MGKKSKGGWETLRKGEKVQMTKSFRQWGGEIIALN